VTGVASSASMRLATYNFLSGGSARRNTHWQLIRSELGPDILLAQECRPLAPLRSERILWAQASARGWGTAVYARGADIEAIDVPQFTGWVVGADVALRGPKRHVRVFSVHCPSGPGGYVRVMNRILDALTPHFAGADVIVGGDLNVVTAYRPDGDVVRMSKGERALLDRLGDEFGLISTWAAANPGRALAQTLRWQANPVTPYHCDGIFIPAAWTAALQRCDVHAGAMWDALSDHNPMCCDILLTKTQEET
jgi:endonuclease/exonuclease/phosphatase family metal-dependent hydrolase